jgi:hypothetical protein
MSGRDGRHSLAARTLRTNGPIAMNDRLLAIRPASPDNAAALQPDTDRPLIGHVHLGKLDGVPLAVVAVDGGSHPADPVERAARAVRFLLLYRRLVTSDATRGIAWPRGSS